MGEERENEGKARGKDRGEEKKGEVRGRGKKGIRNCNVPILCTPDSKYVKSIYIS